jgi:hypothetical protein
MNILQLAAAITLTLTPARFPAIADWQGEAIVMVYTGAAHNGAIGDVAVLMDGVEVARFKSADFGKLDVRPGSIEAIDGVLYATVYTVNWRVYKAGYHESKAYLMRSTDGRNWTRQELSNYTFSVRAAGRPFVSGGQLLIPLYCADAWGNRWAALECYDGKAWRIWSEIKLPGHYLSETSVVSLPDGTLLAAVRTQRKTKEYTPEWVDMWRSVDNGHTWTREPQGIPTNAQKMTLHNGTLYLVGRGMGGVGLWTSADYGRTWSAGQQVDRIVGDGGMADATTIGGRLVLAWYAGQVVRMAEVER